MSDLLRRVKLAAAKLKLPETVLWAEREMQGYRGCELSEIPSYRVGSGTLMQQTKYHGLRHAHGDPESIAALSTSFIREPIGSIEALIASPGDRIVMPIDLEIAKTLSANGYPSEYNVHFTKGILHGIVDAVRNLCLEWAIQQENGGIHGEGVSFSGNEQRKAQEAPPALQIINHGYLHHGDTKGHQNRAYVNSTDSSSNQLSVGVFQELRDELSAKISDDRARAELIRLVDEMREARGSSRFREIYSSFLGLAADHMTIVAPFLPALSSFLS